MIIKTNFFCKIVIKFCLEKAFLKTIYLKNIESKWAQVNLERVKFVSLYVPKRC